MPSVMAMQYDGDCQFSRLISMPTGQLRSMYMDRSVDSAVFERDGRTDAHRQQSLKEAVNQQ